MTYCLNITYFMALWITVIYNCPCSIELIVSLQYIIGFVSNKTQMLNQ